MQRLWLLALCGCRSILGIDSAAVTGDAAGDTLQDGAVVCYGTGLLRVCVDSASVAARSITTTTIVTTDSPDCTFMQAQTNGPEVCVVASKQLAIEPSGSIRAIGSRPLVLLATDTILVAGTLDAASYRQTNNGAGAAMCGVSSGLSSGNQLGAGGGAGGSGSGNGGNGGAGESGAFSGGVGSAALAVTVVKGGCPGGRGGTALSSGGLGGAGGGAVYLIAGSSITVTGTINASGAGGGVAGDGCGGGAGGSGGLIGLDAPVINVQTSANIFALGGGGSSGGGAAAGNPGAEPAGPALPAASVVGPGPAGAGGGGSTQPGRNGKNGGNGMAGGGGGGGGGGASGTICTTAVVPAMSNIAPVPTPL